jgi:acetyl esterase
VLDPNIKGLLDAGREAGAPGLTQMGRDASRDMIRSLSGAESPESPKDVTVRNLDVAGAAGPIPARLYTPAAIASPLGIVYYHGGGFTLGDLDTYEELLRRLATASGLQILAIEYRLAPESKFPAAHDDALAAADWALANAAQIGFAPGRLIVAGDSAGGNLAASTAIAFRDRGSNAVVFQALLYPWLKFTGETPSLVENAEGYLLTRADLDTFISDTFADAADRSHPRVALLDAADLAGLPPALVVTAGYDPLRDEGQAYAKKLETAGVSVQAKHYPQFVHAFYMLTGVTPGAQAAIDEAGAVLRAAALPAQPATAAH